jgi:hypothetical protein
MEEMERLVEEKKAEAEATENAVHEEVVVKMEAEKRILTGQIDGCVPPLPHTRLQR